MKNSLTSGCSQRLNLASGDQRVGRAFYGDALVLLWALLACLCLGSTAVTGIGIWHMVNSIWGGLAATAVYGLVILFTYLFMAFVLMIAFNC